MSVYVKSESPRRWIRNILAGLLLASIPLAQAAGSCADGPICQQTVRHAEDAMAEIQGVIATRNLDITDSSLAMALLVRGNIGCIRLCLDREETRSECRQGLQGAIDELESTYESALRSAREASLDNSYVNSFHTDPQGSEFVRKYFGDASGFGNIDTCGSTNW